MVSPFSNGSGSVTNGTSVHSFTAFPGLPSFGSLSLGDKSGLRDRQTPQSSFQSHSRSSNNSDIERLERLKKEILDGQNPIYKAVPQPDFLESLYLGRTSQHSKPPVSESAEPKAGEQAKSTNGTIGEVRVKEEEAESVLPGIQMSDILALSQKLLSPANFTFTNGPNGVEARKKLEDDEKSKSSTPVQLTGAANGQVDASRNGHYASLQGTRRGHDSPRPDIALSSPPDPPYDPKEGLASSSHNTSAFFDPHADAAYRESSSVGMGPRNLDPSRHSFIQRAPVGQAPNGSAREGSSEGLKGLADRIGSRVPLEERISTPDYSTISRQNSLQERIGDRAPYAADSRTSLSGTPVLSPSAGHPAFPPRLGETREPHSLPPFVQKHLDLTEEVIRQAIHEREAITPPNPSRSDSLDDRADRERSSYPPKFAAKRAEIFPASEENERTRRFSNASSRPTPSDGLRSPHRSDSGRSGVANGPLSWDREGPREPPAIYPPPPPSTSDFDGRFPYTGEGSYREYPSRRRPSDDYRPMKRARDDDYYDVYDRRFVDRYGRDAPPPSPAGYYDDRVSYPPRTTGFYDYDRRPDMGPPFRGVYRPEPPTFIPPPRTA